MKRFLNSKSIPIIKYNYFDLRSCSGGGGGLSASITHHCTTHHCTGGELWEQTVTEQQILEEFAGETV